MNPVIFWVLALSFLGNLALGWAYLGQRDATVAAQRDTVAMVDERDRISATANACSNAVDDLRTIAIRRTTEATTARLQAQTLERRYQTRADAIMATPPAVPGNDCESAQVRVDSWLQARVQP